MAVPSTEDHKAPPSDVGSEAVVVETAAEGTGIVLALEDDGVMVVVNQVHVETPEMRKRFCSRVFAIVGVMLAMCAVGGATPQIFPWYREFCLRFWFLFYVAQAIWLCAYLVIACVPPVRKKRPLNIVVLVLFTLISAWMLSTYTAFFSVFSFYLAAAITMFCCFGLALYARFTKTDFTVCGSVIVVLGLTLSLGMITGIVLLLCFPEVYYLWHLLYCLFGALFCMFVFVYDMQLILGQNRHRISTNEYVYASLVLFTDVLHMFMMILGVAGQR